MKYKSLKVAVINGKVYSVGDEVELSDSEAKRYIEAGFVKPADETTEATEPETTTADETTEATEPETTTADETTEATEPETTTEAKAKKGK